MKKRFSLFILFCLFFASYFFAAQRNTQCNPRDINFVKSCCFSGVFTHAACASTSPAACVCYSISAVASCHSIATEFAEAYWEYRQDEPQIRSFLARLALMPAQMPMQENVLPTRQPQQLQ